MGGPKIPWRPGRIDGFAKDATPDGRLPDASQAHDHLRSVSAISFLVSNRIDAIPPRFSTVWGMTCRFAQTYELPDL